VIPSLLADTGVHLSWNISHDLHALFAFHFMVNALRAGTITAVLASIAGWFMVLRRQTFAGHTLSVVAFPGAAGATWLGVSALWGYFSFSLAAALLISAVPRSQQGAGFSEESAIIGVVQAFALACGLQFVIMYKGFLNGTQALLFGTFLGVTDHQVVILGAAATAALVFFAVVGRPLLFASIDQDVAAARGVPVRLLSTLFLVVLALAVAEVSQITGVLLVFALLVMPAAAAQQLTTRPAAGLALSVLIGLLVTWLGMGVAYFSVYPIGFFVTTFGFAAYVLAVALRLAVARATRRPRQLITPAT
jgi:zinc/manganese transport system permease protein